MPSIDDLAWTEKYRPKCLDDVIGQDVIAERLKAFAKSRSFPNMIFAGPAGVGKTTSALALANEIYGDKINEAFIELNASVTPETPILIKNRGGIERTTMGDISTSYFNDDKSKYAYPQDLEILSVDKNSLKVKFSKIANISRHKVNKIIELKFEGGSVRTSPNHSVIFIDRNGDLKEKRSSELVRGDLLISFKTMLDGGLDKLDLSDFAPNRMIEFVRHNSKPRAIQNPKIYNVPDEIDINKNTAWMFGSFAAEGVTGFSDNTSGISVLTYAYPEEIDLAERAAVTFRRIGFNTHLHTIKSGSSGRESGVQMTVSSTQMARFFGKHFYERAGVNKTAHYKRVPDFVFNTSLENRLEFLKGYMGDAHGKWQDYLRYSSTSQNMLIDVTWLARISGVESTLFRGEARLIWKKDASFYSTSELLPIEPFIRAMDEIRPAFNWRYMLRHQLYWKKSKRIDKKLLPKILDTVTGKKGHEKLDKLRKLISSDIYAIEIQDVKIADYDGYVYDVSVPESEMFWGGTAPVLLHNSDSRGIDVIRGRVKEFARTLPLSSGLVKIIFLDEADALTPEAQHALRRTMERYSATTRFIFSANYASKIIEPIQSRCVVLRFRLLNEDNIKKYVKRIEKREGLEIDEKAMEALIYVCEGDLRKLTNTLQSAAVMSKKISERAIYDIASRARPKEIAAMLKYAISGDFVKARNELNTLMFADGMSGEDILLQCYREALNIEMKDEQKLNLVKSIGEYNFRIVEGANERIQLEAMLASLALFDR